MTDLQHSIKEELENFGVEVEEENVVTKLAELCSELAIKPSDLADEWMAFSVNNKNLELDVENVAKFETYKRSKTVTTPKTSKQRKSIVSVTTSISDLFDDVLDAYLPDDSPAISGTQKRKLESPLSSKLLKVRRTPVRNSGRSHDITGTLSPSNASPSQSYSQRKGSGDVVHSYNSADDIESWEGQHQIDIKLSETTLKRQYKYMFQKLSAKAESLDEHLDIIENLIAEENDVILENLAMPSLVGCTPGQVNVVGRICCDSVGRLNSQSVLLEGSLSLCKGKAVQLDLSHLNSYSIFPGSIVGFKGTNPTGKKFFPTEVLKYPPLKDMKKDIPEKAITIFGACGPFSSSDSLSYEPLHDLIEKVSEENPDVLLLMGPFVDVQHKLIESGDIGNMTFDELIKSQMKYIADNVPASTKVVIMPNSRDVACDNVYPQPPISSSFSLGDHITLVSDPCTVDVSGVTVSLTTTDILFHLSREEISHNAGTDRMGRLANHLLTQRNFYPLYPNSEDLNLDYPHFIKHCFFEQKPDILILPSNLRYFVKSVEDSVVINPGKLDKGTYFKLKVRGGTGRNIAENTVVKILKI